MAREVELQVVRYMYTVILVRMDGGMDLFFLLICACVANEILKWVSCVQGGRAIPGIVGGV